jgi:hypothetical protein
LPDQQVSGETIRYSQDEEAVLQALRKKISKLHLFSIRRRREVLTIANGGEKMPQKSTYLPEAHFRFDLVRSIRENKIEGPEPEKNSLQRQPHRGKLLLSRRIASPAMFYSGA